MIRRPSAVIVPLLALTACASTGADWITVDRSAAPGAHLRIAGTIEHLEIEGGLYVIRDQAGTSWNPTNLPSSFRVPGMPVEADARRRQDAVSIGMAGPLVDLLRIRRRPSAPPADLRGTAWRLEDLAGTPVTAGPEVTLVFSGDDAVSGMASCNTFRGTAIVRSQAISVSPLVATRKACADDRLTAQEQRYLDVLGAVTRFETKGRLLYLSTADGRTLQFVAR